MAPREQSMVANDPASSGAPATRGLHLTPSNVSRPEAAKVLHTAAWCSPRMLPQKAPARAMRGQLVELLAGARITMGGSSERAAKDWHEKPTGSPASLAVTMVMPVAKC